MRFGNNEATATRRRFTLTTRDVTNRASFARFLPQRFDELHSSARRNFIREGITFLYPECVIRNGVIEEITPGMSIRCKCKYRRISFFLSLSLSLSLFPLISLIADA